MIELVVHAFGRPAPQGSHETGQHGHVMHSSNYLAPWRAEVNRATRAAYLRERLTRADMPLIPAPLPVYLTIVHYVTEDQCRATGTEDPTGVPDVDKLVRATIDGLGAARVFANDSQVTDLRTSKCRSVNLMTGARIIITNRRPWWSYDEQGEIPK